MTRALLRCQTCRHSVLDTFTALAGLSISSRPLQPFAIRQVQQPRRKLHSTRPQLQASENTNIPPSQHDTLPPPPDPPFPETDNIPWYLRISTPSPPMPITPHLSSYDIPPLPSDPPPILLPILTHLSTTIGLSHLLLLDLRDLSPPPALGSNLIMIIGTARSTKHLNVSADRFCRLLRTRYKLRPYADGLMGRQELKLKLRRRARRMRLAQAVGRTQDMKEAEEVTTGWVCVNVGIVPEGVVEDALAVEGAEARGAVGGSGKGIEGREEREDDEEDDDNEEEEEEDGEGEIEDNYVGFGSQTTQPRIVVQMFTEDKRMEMDLEGLWDFRNTRREKQAGRVDAVAEKQEMLWREKLREPVAEQGRSAFGRAEEEEEEEEGTGEEAWNTRMEDEVNAPGTQREEGNYRPMGGR